MILYLITVLKISGVKIRNNSWTNVTPTSTSQVCVEDRATSTLQLSLWSVPGTMYTSSYGVLDIMYTSFYGVCVRACTSLFMECF